MKSLRQINLLVVTGCIIALLFTGCTKSKPGMAWIGLHFHTYIAANVVDPVVYSTQFFADSNGRIEGLSVADIYVTNISFRNKSSQTWVTAGPIILKRIDNEIYPIGNIPAGTYDALMFTVGVGNALNSQAPSGYSTTAGADTVLSTTELSAMWGSGATGTSSTPSGYTFMNIWGYDSTDHLPFSYQIGGYGDTVQVTLAYAAGFTISGSMPNTLQLVHVLADYGKLLEAIPSITTSNNKSSFYGASPATANTLLNNIRNMFRYECSIPNGDC